MFDYFEQDELYPYCSPFLETLVLFGSSPFYLLQLRGLKGSMQWVSGHPGEQELGKGQV